MLNSYFAHILKLSYSGPSEAAKEERKLARQPEPIQAACLTASRSAFSYPQLLPRSQLSLIPFTFLSSDSPWSTNRYFEVDSTWNAGLSLCHLSSAKTVYTLDRKSWVEEPHIPGFEEEALPHNLAIQLTNRWYGGHSRSWLDELASLLCTVSRLPSPNQTDLSRGC